jgi:Na+/proline symporter
MAMLNTIAKAITKPMPRMISPKSHSMLDYVTAGVFLAGAGLFWRRNKRAAIASLVSGTAVAAVSAMTEYPGGVNGVFGLERHRDIEVGLAAMIATMPSFFSFEDEPEKNFFRIQGILMTCISELTDLNHVHQPHAEAGSTRPGTQRANETTGTRQAVEAV